MLLIKIYKPDVYLQMPSITDTEEIMEIVEKLVCKEKNILNDILFIKYVKIVYALCDKTYSQDNDFFKLMSTWDDRTKKLFIKKKLDKTSINIQDYSYIVQTYYRFLVRRGQQLVHLPSIKRYEIITAINFTSQFEIQNS